MGNSQGKGDVATTGRAIAITGGTVVKGKATLPKLPPNAVKAQPEDYSFVEVSWSK